MRSFYTLPNTRTCFLDFPNSVHKLVLVGKNFLHRQVPLYNMRSKLPFSTMVTRPISLTWHPVQSTIVC